MPIRPLLPAILLLLAACGDEATAPPRTALLHLVHFELVDASDAAALIRESRALADLPGVVSLVAGAPLKIDRPGIRADYDALVAIGFESRAAYDAYRAHPRHEALGARWRSRIRGLTIRDVDLGTIRDGA